MLKNLINVIYTMSILLISNSAQCRGDAPFFYSKVKLSYSHIDDENTADNVSEIRSHGSRIGIKSNNFVSGESGVLYHLAWKVDMTGRSHDKVKSHDQFIGLKGLWGTILVGRKSTPLKKVQNKIDLFNSLDGDIRNIITGEQRLSNIVQYTSLESFSGLQFNIMVSEKIQTSADRAAHHATSASVTYTGKQFYVGVAQDLNVQGVDSTRIAVQYKINAIKLGMIWQASDLNNKRKIGYVTSLSYQLDVSKIKVQFGSSDMLSKGRELFSLGLDHKLAKATRLHLFYTLQKEDVLKKDKHVFGLAITQWF
jgi:predicted porin